MSVIARNIPIAHDPSRNTIYSVLIRNNLFMHKDKDQVTFVEVYPGIALFFLDFTYCYIYICRIC